MGKTQTRKRQRLGWGSGTGIREPPPPEPLLIPTEISADALITFEFTGVYMLLSAKEIIYIGQTTALGQRIGAHRRRMQFDTVKLQPVDDYEKRLLAETIAIIKYKPRFNLNAESLSLESVKRKLRSKETAAHYEAIEECRRHIERYSEAIFQQRNSIDEYQFAIAERREIIKEHLDAIKGINAKPLRL